MNTTTHLESNALQVAGNTAMTESSRMQASSMMLDSTTMEMAMRVADLMASGKSTVPVHLQKNPSDCLAVVMQSMQWGMNPFAVAQKTHLVNGTLGYEAQLVNAVVQQSNSIQGRFHYEYKGDSPSLQCRVGAVIRGETEITWGNWLSEAKVTTKNSPLWKVNPSQQLGYLQVKNWARLFCPGAILGVYTPEELVDVPKTRYMGAADEVVETIDVRPYLLGARETTTDQAAAAYWKEHNGKFSKQPDDHQSFKDAVIAHRKALKAKTVVDQDTGEIKGAQNAQPPVSKTFDEVMAGLCSAKDIDALYIWGEWIETVDDGRDVLAAKFDEMKVKLEGGAA